MNIAAASNQRRGLKIAPSVGLRGLLAGGLLMTAGTAFAQNSQSPIDITSDTTLYTPDLPPLGFSYGTTTLSVVNTGSPGEESTIRANVPEGAGSVTVSGVVYNLLQFHFHVESEHVINGQPGDMEMHLVHQDVNGNYLVVGRLIEMGAHNDPLDPIFSNLPPDSSAPTLPVFNFDLESILPTASTTFRYSGSLTTSPYTEPVQWIITSEHLEMSQDQIDAFAAVFDGPHGNYRELQPLNGRTVQTDVAGFSTIPEPSTFTLLVAGLGLLLSQRRRTVQTGCGGSRA